MFMAYQLDLKSDESNAIGKFAGMALSQYSQAQETQADDWGMRLLDEAGFNIEEGPKVYAKMGQTEEIDP